MVSRTKILLALPVLAALIAAAPAPTWQKKTRYASVSLTLPKQVQHVPVLADRLQRGETKALMRFAADAASPAEGVRSEPADFRDRGPWEMQVTYEGGVETPRLIGLTRTSFSDTHGAHPMHTLGGVVFDKTTNQNLHPVDLLQPGADLRPLDHALCDAARAAKRSKDDQWKEKEDSNFSCPTWRGLRDDKGKLTKDSAQITLAPGDAPGRAAGLIFLYSPYDIGSYAEGEYRVLIPAAAFQRVLKPDYAGEFGGKPRPVSQDQ